MYLIPNLSLTILQWSHYKIRSENYCQPSCAICTERTPRNYTSLYSPTYKAVVRLLRESFEVKNVLALLTRLINTGAAVVDQVQKRREVFSEALRISPEKISGTVTRFSKLIGGNVPA